MLASRSAASVEVDDFSTGMDGAPWDDLSRQVYCVLGIPIDAIDMPELLWTVERAATRRAPFLISTPNLNHLITSRGDPEFRESLLSSELCPADGMMIVWIARLVGAPIKERVAGSDMLPALKARCPSLQRVKLFLFGGSAGVVEAAAKALNSNSVGLSCIGTNNPGYGTIQELSHDHFIEEINASGADFLIAALGAQKGQLWLKRNSSRLRIPVRAHLGASLSFVAGSVKRAPTVVQKFGLEWLWRIKEEPYLWRRYLGDGMTLLGLMLTRVLPLAVRARWNALCRHAQQDLVIARTQDHRTITLGLSGACTARNAEKAVPVFREAIATRKDLAINLSNTSAIDARFLGLLLMVRKEAKKGRADMGFTGVPSRLQKLFKLNGVEFLLAGDSDC
jgi:N-acetylglucosaminyldiphosphoundecaprenol N-acetyl-beta-D-mannosaminyltransferase